MSPVTPPRRPSPVDEFLRTIPPEELAELKRKVLGSEPLVTDEDVPSEKLKDPRFARKWRRKNADRA